MTEPLARRKHRLEGVGPHSDRTGGRKVDEISDPALSNHPGSFGPAPEETAAVIVPPPARGKNDPDPVAFSRREQVPAAEQVIQPPRPGRTEFVPVPFERREFIPRKDGA